MSPRHGYHRTLFSLLALFIAAVAVAIPYSSLTSHGAGPDLSMAASLHKVTPARPSIPVVHSVAQKDPQSARIAQADARESYHATVLLREARQARRARAQAQAQAAAAASAQAATPAPAPAQASPAVPAAQGDPQQIAMSMLPGYGWPSSEFSCLQQLWNTESGWNVYASNPGSGAYGIPQALPGSKMASAGADWQTSATTQIRWGLGYLKSVYGSPCAGWSHEGAFGWY